MNHNTTNHKVKDDNKKGKTYKLLIILIILCLAIMSTVVALHRQQPKKADLTNDARTLFTPGRSIKPFELQSKQGNFSEKNFKGSWTLLFFGFTHCGNVCPATLGMIKKAYPELKLIIPNLQVVLISLDPTRDNLETLNNYTQQFNKDFIGVTGKLSEIRKVQSQFGIFAAKDDAPDSNSNSSNGSNSSNSNNNNNYQIIHTSSILLINPQGEYSGLFKYGLTPNEFKEEVKSSIRLLT